MVKYSDILFVISIILSVTLCILWLCAKVELKQTKDKLENTNKEIVIYQFKLDSLSIRRDAEQEILHNMSDSDAVALFYKLLSDK